MIYAKTKTPDPFTRLYPSPNTIIVDSFPGRKRPPSRLLLSIHCSQDTESFSLLQDQSPMLAPPKSQKSATV